MKLKLQQFYLVRLMNLLTSVQSCVSHFGLDWSLLLPPCADLLSGFGLSNDLSSWTRCHHANKVKSLALAVGWFTKTLYLTLRFQSTSYQSEVQCWNEYFLQTGNGCCLEKMFKKYFLSTEYFVNFKGAAFSNFYFKGTAKIPSENKMSSDWHLVSVEHFLKDQKRRLF